jgi:hypothetical protein
VQAGLFDGLFGGGNSEAEMEKEEAYRCVVVLTIEDTKQTEGLYT